MANITPYKRVRFPNMDYNVYDINMGQSIYWEEIGVLGHYNLKFHMKFIW